MPKDDALPLMIGIVTAGTDDVQTVKQASTYLQQVCLTAGFLHFCENYTFE